MLGRHQKGNQLRGTLDFLLLATLRQGPLYGLRIIQQLHDTTGGYFEFKEGTVYPALHRLEKRGLIRAELQPSDVGGPPRKYYGLTTNGHTELRQQQRDHRAYAGALQPYLEFA